MTQLIERVAPAPKPIARTVVTARRGRTLARDRTVEVGAVSCVATTRRTVRAPRTVAIRIAGRRYRATVLAPAQVGAGGQARVRLRLSPAAATRLAGRRGSGRLVLRTTAPQASPLTASIAIDIRGRRTATHR